MDKHHQSKTEAFLLEPREIKLIALYNGMNEDAKVWLLAKCVELADRFPFENLIEHKKLDSAIH